MRNLSFKIILLILASLIIPISSQAEESKVYKLRDILVTDYMVVIESVQFDTGKINPNTHSYSILDELTQICIEHPELKIRIDGYTDSVGSETYNLKLSKERADYVMKYLISKGVPAEQLTTKGFGESDPIADNSTKEGRAKNRRIEFFIIGQ